MNTEHYIRKEANSSASKLNSLSLKDMLRAYDQLKGDLKNIALSDEEVLGTESIDFDSFNNDQY